MVRTALVLVVGLLLFPQVPADAAASLPVDPVPERIAVEKDDGTRITAARVERWPGDFVRIVSGAGEARFLSVHAVRAIRDESGTDVTERVLRGWEGFGTMPTAPALVQEPSPKRIPARFRQEFAVLQGVVLGRVSAPAGESHVSIGIDLGTMRNLSSNHAVGGTLGLLADGDYLRIALKPRLRRWLSNSVAVDVAPGIFHSVDSDNSPTTHGPVGFLLETSITYDGMTATGQVEVVETERGHYGSTPSATEASYHLGLKIGGGAAFGTGIVLLLATAAIGSMTGADTY